MRAGPPSASAGSRRPSYTVSQLSGADSPFAEAAMLESAGSRMHRYSLRFLDAHLEKTFQFDHATAILPMVRMATVCAMVVCIIMSSLNEVVEPSSSYWPHTESAVFPAAAGVLALLTVGMIAFPAQARRHAQECAWVLMIAITFASLVSSGAVREMDRPYVMVVLALMLGAAPWIFTFVHAALFQTFAMVIHTPFLLSNEFSSLLDPGYRLSAMLCIGAGYLVLLYFTLASERNRRALFLLRRRLHRRNLALQKQVRLMEVMRNAHDLDGPIMRVVSALQGLREKHSDDPSDTATLSMALALIARGDLFNTRISESVGSDSDVRAYLNAELGQSRGSGRHKSVVSSVGTQRRLSRLPELSATPLLLPDEEVQLAGLLKEIGEWTFDVFKVAENSNQRPLQVVGMRVFEQLGLIDRFGLDPAVLRAFLGKVEAGYNKVPYHTSTHAADVLHGVYYLCRNEVAKQYLSDVDVLALAIAAVIHDYQHPGINNNFLIATGHELAVLYNDRSVLENHHAASAFALMREDRSANILRDMEEDERKTVRRLVIEFVLATDFSKHFEILNQFKGKLSGDGLSDSDPDDALLLCKVLIKMADISNVTKGPELSRKWADAVMAEFWAQGDKEREAGLPVSTFFDRREPLVAKCQSSFIGFLVRPLAAPVFELLEEPGLLQQLDENRRGWDAETEM